MFITNISNASEHSLASSILYLNTNDVFDRQSSLEFNFMFQPQCYNTSLRFTDLVVVKGDSRRICNRMGRQRNEGVRHELNIFKLNDKIEQNVLNSKNIYCHDNVPFTKVIYITLTDQPNERL